MIKQIPVWKYVNMVELPFSRYAVLWGKSILKMCQVHLD